jgi:hypothetical protein
MIALVYSCWFGVQLSWLLFEDNYFDIPPNPVIGGKYIFMSLVLVYCC